MLIFADMIVFYLMTCLVSMRVVTSIETSSSHYDIDAFHIETVHELQDKEHVIVKSKNGLCKYKKGEWTVCDRTFMVS